VLRADEHVGSSARAAHALLGLLMPAMIGDPRGIHHLYAVPPAPASGRSSRCRGVTRENLEKQVSVCVSAGLDHGYALASH